MHFTDEQIEKMQAIFKRLDPSTVISLQKDYNRYPFRTGYTYAIYDKWGKPNCVFQNFATLSPYRMKLLMRLSGQIPFEIHITNPQEGVQCIGWKI